MFNIQTMFHTRFVGTFTIYLHTKLHTPRPMVNYEAKYIRLADIVDLHSKSITCLSKIYELLLL